jgi:hypothetical protein
VQQTPAVEVAEIGSPWPDRVDADLYNAIVRQVRDYPGGARFTYLVQSIYGRENIYTIDSEGQRRPSAEYQRVDRAVADLVERGIVSTEKRPQIRIVDDEAVEIARQNDPVWLYPEWIPPFLKRSRCISSLPMPESPNRQTARGRDSSSVQGSLPDQAPGGKAAQNARQILRDRCSITPGPAGADVRAALRHALAAHRQGVDSVGMRGDRVSDPAIISGHQGTYLSAWELAGDQFEVAVVGTLTGRPGESGDMVDSAVGVVESIDPLRGHLARQTPGSGRPVATVVSEVTARGVLHLHVVVFGVTKASIDRDALSRYWYETRGHGYIVDVAGIEREGGRWVWADHDDAPTDRGRYPRSYLGETLHRFRAVAEADAETIHETAGRGWWTVALMWACGLPLPQYSPSLRTTSRDSTAAQKGGNR